MKRKGLTMLWVYGHYTFFYSFSAVIVFRRKIQTSKDGPCAERVNIPSFVDLTFCEANAGCYIHLQRFM